LYLFIICTKMWQYAIDFAISLSDTEIKIISAYHANNTQAVIKQMICLSPAFRNQLREVADVKFFMFRPAMLYA